MRVRTFGASLLYAALAASAALAALVLFGPFIGPYLARDAVLALAVALYAAGLLDGVARRSAVFAGVMTLSAALVALGASGGELAVALTAVLAVVRSGLAYRLRPARAAVAESALGLAALALAGLLYHGTAPSFALAIWGFFLVQSTAFLIGGRAARASGSPPPDPFETAYRRAERILEGGV